MTLLGMPFCGITRGNDVAINCDVTIGNDVEMYPYHTYHDIIIDNHFAMNLF